MFWNINFVNIKQKFQLKLSMNKKKNLSVGIEILIFEKMFITLPSEAFWQYTRANELQRRAFSYIL